jgi:hypothetical protein
MRHKQRLRFQLLPFVFVVVFSGCEVIERLGGIVHTRLETAEMKPYLQAASRSQRIQLGFTALPQNGPVLVEKPRFKKYYDVMLHIDGPNVTRMVEFIIRNGQPVWSGEQEMHWSPRQFETIDGTVREHLVISYQDIETPEMSKGEWILYGGPDESLQWRSDRHQISIADAKEVWDAWPK